MTSPTNSQKNTSGNRAQQGKPFSAGSLDPEWLYQVIVTFDMGKGRSPRRVTLYGSPWSVIPRDAAWLANRLARQFPNATVRVEPYQRARATP